MKPAPSPAAQGIICSACQSTEMEIVHDGGGKEFALEIAEVVYDTQLGELRPGGGPP